MMPAFTGRFTQVQMANLIACPHTNLRWRVQFRSADLESE
jgi:hypothetical protein